MSWVVCCLFVYVHVSIFFIWLGYVLETFIFMKIKKDVRYLSRYLWLNNKQNIFGWQLWVLRSFEPHWWVLEVRNTTLQIGIYITLSIYLIEHFVDSCWEYKFLYTFTTSNYAMLSISALSTLMTYIYVNVLHTYTSSCEKERKICRFLWGIHKNKDDKHSVAYGAGEFWKYIFYPLVVVVYA